MTDIFTTSQYFTNKDIKLKSTCARSRNPRLKLNCERFGFSLKVKVQSFISHQDLLWLMGPYEPGLDPFKGPDDRAAGFPSSSGQRLSVELSEVRTTSESSPDTKNLPGTEAQFKTGAGKDRQNTYTSVWQAICVFIDVSFIFSHQFVAKRLVYPTMETVSPVSGALTYISCNGN